MAKKEEKKLNEKAVETALANIKSFCRKASTIKDPDYISTGHFYLDLAVAHGVSPDESDFDITKYDLKNLGGFPLGYLVELSGPEGSGKSSLAYRVVGQAQKRGMKCAWIDAEFSFSKKLAVINGANLDELDVADLVDTDDPTHLYSAEEIFERICDLCLAGYKVIVLDSVANLTTRAELDNRLDEGGVGIAALAAVLSKALKKIVNFAAKFGAMVIVVNQMREKPGVLFGNPETTPGGRALKHLESVRIQMKKQFGDDGKIKQTDDEGNEKTIGGNRYVYILKNRFGQPVEKSIMIPVYYTYHFPGVEEMVFDQGRKLNIITKYKSEFRWDGLKGVGKQGFLAACSDQMGKLVQQIKDSAVEEKIILPPEVMNYEGPKEKVEIKNDEGDEIKLPRRRKAKDTVSEPGEPVEV